MKFKITREGLLGPLQQVIGVVERRQTLSLLSNVLLQMDDSTLSVTGSDTEVELVAHCQVLDGEEGAVTVPGRKLVDICRALPDGANVDVELRGSRVAVHSGQSRFLLATLPAADYPAIPQLEAPRVISLSQVLLKEMIARTQFCMAHQDVRYYLNGLLLEVASGGVRAVATDGHRLAFCGVEAAIEMDEEVQQVIVPRKGVAELVKILEEDSEEKATLRITSSHVQVEVPGVCFTSKLIDGRFPEYERVIPEPKGQRLFADRSLLRRALSRTAILANEKYRGVRLSLEADRLILTTHNPEQEEAQEELVVEYQGEPLEIGFNVSYLLDALGAMTGEMVEMWLRDGNSSCLVREENAQCRYVVMPMRL